MGAVERGIEHVDVAGDLPAQRDAGLQRPPHEAGPAERGEQRLVDSRRAGEQPDEDAIGGVECLQRGGAGAARDVADDGNGVLGRLLPPLIDGGDDELDAPVGGLHHLIGDRSGELGHGGDDLVGGDRQGRRVEDLPVEQVGDLVKLLWEEPPGHRQAGIGRRILEPLDEDSHVLGVELLDVVDDDHAVAERLVAERAELAAKSQRALRSRAPQQPRLAEPGRRLDERDAGRAGIAQPGQQRPLEASEGSSVVVNVGRGRPLRPAGYDAS